jgi:hypothetical protein
MTGLKGVADWIAATPPSVAIQKNEVWAIPTIQSIHIAGIGVVLGCVLMMSLRIFGYACADRTLAQTEQRFGPWLRGALWLLLGTGLLLIIGEPERELVTFSFWAKMTLVVIGVLLAWRFHRSVQAGAAGADPSPQSAGPSLRTLAIVAVLIVIAIVFLGRLIAYDHVWGPLSPATKA